MHRNTRLVIFFLAILAGIVTVANLRKTENPEPQVQQTFPTPTPTSDIFAGAVRYDSDECGISLVYPRTHEFMENPEEEGGVQFIRMEHPTETITLSCAKTIKPPDVTADMTLEYTAASVSGILYRGVKDAFIFTNPKNNLEVKIGGVSILLKKVLETLIIE